MAKKNIQKKDIKKEMKNYKKIKEIVKPFYQKHSATKKEYKLTDWTSSISRKLNIPNKSA